MDFLSISDLRCPIEPRNVCLGRQPAGSINRLSHPRAVLETIYAGRHNGAINIDIDLCRSRRLRRRAFGCLSARSIAGSRLHQRARTISPLKRHAAGTAAKVRHRQAARHRNDNQYRHHHCLMTEQLVRQAVHPFDPFVLFALRHSKTSQQHRVRKRALQQPRSKTGFSGQTKS